MGARAHVLLVSVSLSSLVTTGCIFGKKKVPQAKAVPTAAPSELDAQLDPRAAEGLRSGAHALKPERNAEALTQLPKYARGAAPSPAAPAPAPKDSGVEWPKPEELAIGAGGAPRAPRASVADATPPIDPANRTAATPAVPPAAAAAAAADDRVIIRDAAAAPLQPPAQPQHGEQAVANRPLELPSGGAAASSGEPRPAAHVVTAAAPIAPQQAEGIGAQVAQRLRDNPSDLAAHLDYQLLRFVMDEQVPELNSISSLPAEDRELLTALMDGLSNFRSGLRTDQNMLMSKKVRPLLDLAARVSSQADLTIPTIALCRRVGGYGTYDPIDARFVAGNRNEAIVYCEVGNVSSQQNEQGIWESRLSQEAVLYTEDGQRVWSNPAQAIVDKSRNRRHDFCVAQKLTLPPNLSINRYILKVTVKDEQAKRMAEAAMPIQIVAVLEAQPPVTSAPLTSAPPVQQQQQQPQPQPQQQQPQAPAPVDAQQGLNGQQLYRGTPRTAADRQPAGRATFGTISSPPTQTADTK